MDKDCSNCRSKDRDVSEKPCSKCFDSFAGMPFPFPSEWEELPHSSTEREVTGPVQSVNRTGLLLAVQ